MEFTLTAIWLLLKAIDEIYFNSSAATDLSRLSDLIGVLLKVLESEPGAVTARDVQRLTTMMENAAATQIYFANATQEAVVSLTTDYLRLASEMITPDMAAQWVNNGDAEVRFTQHTKHTGDIYNAETRFMQS